MNGTFDNFFKQVGQHVDTTGVAHPQFWRIAQQLQLRDVEHINEILNAIDAGTHVYAARQLTQLRKLGMIRSITDSNLQVTDMGRRFLGFERADEQKATLDQQVLKIWLFPISQTPFDVYPAAKLLEILCHLQSVTFVEYVSVLIWVQQDSSAEYIAHLISEFRALPAIDRNEVTRASIDLVDTKEAFSYLARLYKLLKLSSFFADVPTAEAGMHGGIRLAIPTSRAQEIAEMVSNHRPLDIESYERWLDENDIELQALIQREMSMPKVAPGIDSIDGAGPTVAPASEGPDGAPVQRTAAIGRPAIRRGLREQFPNWGDLGLRPPANYVARAETATAAGRRAELIVVQHERNSLMAQNKADLAGLVAHVAKETDSLSYDVHSFHPNGVERHIEVKSISPVKDVAIIHVTYSELLRAQVDRNYELALVAGSDTPTPQVMFANDLLSALIASIPVLPIEGSLMIATPESWIVEFSIRLS